MRAWNLLLGAAALVVLTGCPGAEAPTPSSEEPAASTATAAGGGGAAAWLNEATQDFGVDFVHETLAQGELLFPEMSGAGVATFDANEDGHMDLVLLAGAAGPQEEPQHRFYMGGAGGAFRDLTDRAGLGGGLHAQGVAVGDFDNDGHDDLFISSFTKDRLLRGKGDGTFEDVTAAAGIALEKWSTSSVFCDVDRDGYLDLYVAHYVVYDGAKSCTDNSGRPEYCGPDSYDDEIDVLLHNNGDGTFTDITKQAGIDQATGAGLGVVCEDLNDDGWADIYVANDGDPNQLWINQKDGTFYDEALILGAGVNAEGLHEAGMGVLAADFDNDADFDLFLSHLRDETNTLYKNLGGGRGFQDESIRFGVALASTPYTGFGTAALDVEQDGDLDLVVINGRVLRGKTMTEEVPEPWNAYAEPNLFFLNDGTAFRPATTEAAPLTELAEVSRGLAIGDLDADGDLDIVVTNIQGPARIYRNDAPDKGHWLIVDAFEGDLGRRALGARITVTAGGKSQVRTIQGAMSYLSSSDPRAHFGLGDVATVDEITVRWADGTSQTFPGVEVDQAIELRRGSPGGEPNK